MPWSRPGVNGNDNLLSPDPINQIQFSVRPRTLFFFFFEREVSIFVAASHKVN